MRMDHECQEHSGKVRGIKGGVRTGSFRGLRSYVETQPRLDGKTRAQAPGGDRSEQR